MLEAKLKLGSRITEQSGRSSQSRGSVNLLTSSLTAAGYLGTFFENVLWERRGGVSSAFLNSIGNVLLGRAERDGFITAKYVDLAFASGAHHRGRVSAAFPCALQLRLIRLQQQPVAALAFEVL